MSTSFLTGSELKRWVDKLGLKIILITADPYAHDAEFRIIRGAEEIVFQGMAERCSDFIKGYLQGAK